VDNAPLGSLHGVGCTVPPLEPGTRATRKGASEESETGGKSEAVGFAAHGHYGEGPDSGGNWSCHAEFWFRLALCNHRPVSTNITEIRLDGSALNPAVVFERCEFQSDIQLDHGIAKSFMVKANATILGVRLNELGPFDPVDLRNLKISVVDGFGDSHFY
jgi:hypothetical protein